MSFLNIGHKLDRVMGKEQELLDAARLGNVAAIDKLLSNKPRKSTVGGPMGHVGSGLHKLSSIFKSVNVNCTDKNGYTPLHHAAVNGHRIYENEKRTVQTDQMASYLPSDLGPHWEAVECLLRAEAQPRLTENQGCNPVHLAAWSGKPEIVLLLLNAGTVEIEPGVPSPVEPVHVNQQNGDGDTALHSAAQYGHCAVVDVLLQKHANPTIRNLKEESPLDLAAQYGRKDVVQRVLISHPELSQRPECTQSPLHLASRNGHKDIVEVLLANKFDIQAKTDTGTALHEAALHGKLDVVKLLLEEGIDVDCQDSQGRTALQLLGDHQAQQKSYTEITNVIIEHMNKSSRVQLTDPGLYETLSTCTSGTIGDKPTATVKPLLHEKQPADTTEEKHLRFSPDKPTPAPRSSMIQLSPDHPTGPVTLSGLYCQPIKIIDDDETERVASSTSMLGSPEAPPLPPRVSVFQIEDRFPAPPPPPPEPSVQPLSGSVHKSHVAPKKPTRKKPPRQGKSPNPTRRATVDSPPPIISRADRHLPDQSRMTESSPTPLSEPNSETSHIPDDSRTIPDNSRTIPTVTYTEADVSSTSSQHSRQIDQPDSGIGSGFNQSDFNNAHTNQFKDTKEPSNEGAPLMSPMPPLPPRELGPFGVVDPNLDASVNPLTGVPVNQSVYMEMTSRQSIEQSGKPVCDVKPEPVSETKQELKPEDTKVDSYGILFPKFKNDSPRNTKRPGLVRSNTTPEENVYVGPDPISHTEKFKEKQGMLRRTNTAPEDHEYFVAIEMEKNKQGNEGQVNENEYAEIGEKSPPPPCSPGENIYETIKDSKQGTESVYSQIWTVSSDSSAKNNSQKPPLAGGGTVDGDGVKVNEDQVGDDTKDVTTAVVTEVGDTSTGGGDYVVAEREPKGCIKPTYLEFVKKRSSIPLTPTGYVQPPTPEFPPPSPATAMLGIEMKIQEMDAKRKSRDITTETDTPADETVDISKKQLLGSQIKVTAQTVKGFGDKGSENQNSNDQRTFKQGEDAPDKGAKLLSSATVPIVATALTDDRNNSLTASSTVPSNCESSFPVSFSEADGNSEKSVINISDQNLPNQSSIPKNQSVIESEAAGSELLGDQSEEEDMADKQKPAVPHKPAKNMAAGNQKPVVASRQSKPVPDGNQKPVVSDKPTSTAGSQSPVVPDKPFRNQSPVVPDKPARNQPPGVPDKPASTTGSQSPVVPDKPFRNQSPVVPDKPARNQSPVVPDKPAGNQIPVVPDKPAGNQSPVVPDKPAGNQTPVVPDKPARNQSPVVPDKPAGNQSPVVPDKPAGNQTPVVPDKPVPPETASPVMMRKKSSTASNPDMDLFKVDKEIQSLLRGSVIAGPTRIVSKFYEDVLQKAKTNKRASLPPLAKGDKSSPMEADEDIDVDQVMSSIDVEVARRSSQHDSAKFDDDEEWAQIADIMSSFGGNLTPSHNDDDIQRAFEADLDKLLSQCSRGSNHVVSVREWLESIGQGHYENAFIANGFDNVDFLDPKVLEEQDLEQIGVLGHEDRRQILDAASSLPVLTPLDPDNQPACVEEWLMSLQLVCYLETFESSGYDTMEKVESILWDLQLRTVLDISMLGHRKRILASLGERHPPTRQNNSLRRHNLSTSPDNPKSPYLSLDLYKDYNNIKPHSSSEEDIDKTTQMAIDSSEDEDVFNRKTSTSGSSGQSIRNKDITLRPPHMAQTQSPAKQWRHKPDMLIKGCCNYTAQYLGSTIVADLTGGTDSTRAGITKLKKSTDVLAKIPVILLSISYKGVKFIDAKSKKVICDHEIGNIFCACQDTENLNFFAYITRDIQTGQHYCHVFSVKSASLAHDIILTLGESFEVAYQMALKEKANAGAMELDRKMSSTSEDPDDLYSVVHKKPATNTV